LTSNAARPATAAPTGPTARSSLFAPTGERFPDVLSFLAVFPADLTFFLAYLTYPIQARAGRGEAAPLKPGGAGQGAGWSPGDRRRLSW